MTSLPTSIPAAGRGLHPLLATAAIAVTLASLTAIATMTGLIGAPHPSDASLSPHGTTADSASTPAPAAAAASAAASAAPAAASSSAPSSSAPSSSAPAAAAPSAAAPAQRAVSSTTSRPVAAARPAAAPQPAGAAPVGVAAVPSPTPAPLPSQAQAPAPEPVAAAPAAGSAAPPTPAPADDTRRIAAEAARAWATVESVRAVQVPGQGTGAGAILGAIGGAVLGNQIGSGRGSTVGAVIGAAGGGYAGHEIEKRARTGQRHELTVRTEDGQLRTFTRDQPWPYRAGDRVRLDDPALLPQRSQAPRPAPVESRDPAAEGSTRSER